MSRYGKNWVEVIVKLLITATVLLGIIFGYAMLSGCSQAERAKLTMIAAETSAEAAMEAGLDRLERTLAHFIDTPPVEQSEENAMLIQGVGSLSLALMYMARKKFFPMGKR